MIALVLAAVLVANVASALQPGGEAADIPPAATPPAGTPPSPAAASGADLEQWIAAQPEVRAYQQLTARRGVQPPPADSFRRQPTLPRDIACRTSQSALGAAVRLFHASDEGKIMLDPAMAQTEPGRTDATLNNQQKELLQDQGRQYEQAAGEFEPACLG